MLSALSLSLPLPPAPPGERSSLAHNLAFLLPSSPGVAQWMLCVSCSGAVPVFTAKALGKKCLSVHLKESTFSFLKYRNDRCPYVKPHRGLFGKQFLSPVCFVIHSVLAGCIVLSWSILAAITK